VPHSGRQGFPGVEKILTAEGAENAEKNDSKSRISNKENDFVNSFLLSFRRKPEFSIIKILQTSWTPVFTGVTTFYEIIKKGFYTFLSKTDMTRPKGFPFDFISRKKTRFENQ
jgi:hypothetical protein